MVKRLLVNVAVVIIVAVMEVLANISGVVDGFHRWVNGHGSLPRCWWP